jgi:uncharacterized protein YfaP (DUF2135 family)
MRQLHFQADGVSAEQSRRWKTPSRGVAIAGVIVGAIYVADPPVQIKLTEPGIRTTTASIVKVAGEIPGARSDTVALNVNGSLLAVPVTDAKFVATVPLVPGENTIEVTSGGIVSTLMGGSSAVRIFADIKPADIWTQLTWDGPGDIDLHLLLPNNELCFYNNKKTQAGAALDIDNTIADGPEHIVMEHAIPGAYRLSVLYYSASDQTRRTVSWQVVVRLRNEELQRFSGKLSRVKEEQVVRTFNF